MILPYTDTPKSMIEADFISPNEFRLLAVLNSYAFMQSIFPAQKELAEKCNITNRTVINCLNRLRDEVGCIKSVQRISDDGGLTTNLYEFVEGSWNGWYEKNYGDGTVEEFKTEAVTTKKLYSVDGIKVREKQIPPFVRAYNEFLYSKNLTANELRTFLYLKGFANCDKIYPKYETIMKGVGVSKQTIVNTIQTLGDKNLIFKIVQFREDGGNISNEYLILNDEELKGWLTT